MKNYILLFISFLTFNAISQELTKKINVTLAKKTDVFQIVEEQKKQVSLFFSDKQKVRAIRFNDNFDVIDSLSVARPSDDYDDIIGYSISDNNYFSYWSNSNKKEIAGQCFDFEKKEVTLKTFSLDFEKEKLVEEITVNNTFYIVTILKKSSILNFYRFNGNTLEKKNIDLSNKRFLDSENKSTNLWGVFNEGNAFQPSLTVQNISADSPASLTFSANKKKVYTDGHFLTFTFDNNSNFTQVVKINLSDYSANCKLFNQPIFTVTQYNTVDSNSFLSDDKIIQMKSNSEKMILLVKDLEGNELKSFEIIADQEIPFKNSEIVQENGNVRNTRILDKSNQLLRKINNLYPSLSCYSLNDHIYLTLGGVSLVQNNNGAMYGAMIGGFTGALIGAAISSNYSMNNLNSYTNRKVVYINCLFDKNFNHVDGDLKKLSFDNLRVHADKNNHLTSQTVFKLNTALFHGGYDKESKVYSFYKFLD